MSEESKLEAAVANAPPADPVTHQVVQMDPASIAAIVSQSIAQTFANLQAAAAAPSPTLPSNPTATPMYNWSLLKTLCPDQLNITSFSNNQQKRWHRQFVSFLRESKIQTAEWTVQVTALETAMTESTFQRVDSMRRALPVDHQKDINKVLEMTQKLIDGEKSTWAKRSLFEKFQQTKDQTCRDFYSEAVEMADECDFGQGFCNRCSQKIVDLFILMKIVFGTVNDEARRRMLKKKDLSLQDAREILEADEALRSTEATIKNEVEENLSVQKIRRPGAFERGESPSTSRKRSPNQQRSNRNPGNSACGKCGLKHPGRRCPAEGDECHNCGKLNHWGRVCRQKENQDETQDAKSRKKMGRIRCAKMSKAPDLVEVIVRTSNDERTIPAIMDTGSDWCCIPIEDVEKIGENPHNLYPPTNDMLETVNASGQPMNPDGYVEAEIEFDGKLTKQPVVVFPGIDEFILSKSALQDLEIVKFNIKPRQQVGTIRNESSSPDETHPSPSASARTAQPVSVSLPRPKSAGSRSSPLSTKTELLTEFADVFAPRNTPMKGGKFNIVLAEDAKPCRVHHARNIPTPIKEKVREELEDLVKAGHISKKKETTEWCSPIVVATKKDSDRIRLCVDFRQLNKYCVRELYDSPSIIEEIQSIGKAKYFTQFDAKKGYHQIEMTEKSKDLTTFMTPFGRYRYERAPFGINSIPEHFNRRMADALEGLENYVRIVDDCLVYGETVEEHDRAVRNFLQRCREQNIHLNEKKFEYCKEEAQFGGMTITPEGFSVQPKVIEAIQKFAAPTSMTEMKRFQGLVNQLSPFDSKLAQKFDSLRHLLKKSNTPFEMSEDDIHNFENVKKQLISPRSLAYFTPGRPIHVYTDAACTSGFGFVVKQLQRDNKTWKPIMFGSRALTDAERNYAPIEAEMTALAWALKKARMYLQHGPAFKVFTDHKPLISLVNKKRYNEILNNRLLNALLSCQGFTFEAEYIKGSDNEIADCLSRGPTSKPDDDDTAAGEEISHRVNFISASHAQEAEYAPRLQHLKEIAIEDSEYQELKNAIVDGFPESKAELSPTLCPYWNVRHDLSISDDGFILYGVRLVIPKAMRKQVLDDLHASHKGIDLTKARARLVVYWPMMDYHIEKKCRACERCSFDRSSQPSEPEIHQEVPSRAFEIISADFATVEGKKFLIITDWKTGWFSTRQMSQTTAAATIHHLRAFFSETAVPRILFTDNGPPFTSVELRDFMNRWGVQWKSSSPYHPKSNSYAENGVKSAKALLRKCINNGKLDHEEWSRGLLCIRNTPHKATGLSPAIMLYGHSVQDITPAHKSALDKSWHVELSNIDKKIAKERQRQDKYNPGKPLPVLKVGTPVVIQNRQTKRWDKFGVIQERNLSTRKYTIRLPSGMLTVRNRIVIKLRHPPPNVNEAGTSVWQPFQKNAMNELDQNDKDSEDGGEDEDFCDPGAVNQNHEKPQQQKEQNEQLERQIQQLPQQRTVQFDDNVEVIGPEQERAPIAPRRSTRQRRRPQYLNDYVTN